jgi:hypothetical protein
MRSSLIRAHGGPTGTDAAKGSRGTGERKKARPLGLPVNRAPIRGREEGKGGGSKIEEGEEDQPQRADEEERQAEI